MSFQSTQIFCKLLKTLVLKVQPAAPSFELVNTVFVLLRFIRQSSGIFGEGRVKEEEEVKKRDRIIRVSVTVVGVVTLAPHREGRSPSPLW